MPKQLRGRSASARRYEPSGTHRSLGWLAPGWARPGCTERRTDPRTPATRIALACQCQRHTGFGPQAECQTQDGSAVDGQGGRGGSWRMARTPLQTHRRIRRLSVGAMPLHPSSADVDSGKFNRWAAPEIVTPIVQRLLPSIAYATNDATLGARHAGRLCLRRAQGRNVKNGLRWTGAPHRMRHGSLHAEIDSFAVGMNPRARIIGEQLAAVQFRNSDDVALRVDPMKTRASR